MGKLNHAKIDSLDLFKNMIEFNMKIKDAHPYFWRNISKADLWKLNTYCNCWPVVRYGLWLKCYFFLTRLQLVYCKCGMSYTSLWLDSKWVFLLLFCCWNHCILWAFWKLKWHTVIVVLFQIYTYCNHNVSMLAAGPKVCCFVLIYWTELNHTEAKI